MYKYQETIIYKDELNDDFGNTIHHNHPLPEKYKIYSKNFFIVIFNFIFYWIVVRPIAFLYMKIKFHYKIKNKKEIKKLRNKGYLIFANHALIIGDAFGLNMVDYRKRNYILTGPEVSSLTKILHLLRGIGSLPVTSSLKRNVELSNAMKYILKNKRNTITIFPEAHIWPYYTKIRNFRYESFKYAIQFDVPVVVLTNVFNKKRFGKTPKITGYLSQVLYPDKTLNKKDAAIKLRDETYNIMVEYSKYSNYEYYNYIKKEENINE